MEWYDFKLFDFTEPPPPPITISPRFAMPDVMPVDRRGGFLPGIALRHAEPERRRRYMTRYYKRCKSMSRRMKVCVRRELLKARVAN